MKKSVFLLLILFLSLFSGCKREKARYIFLITLDTTRADYINYSKKDNNLTPNLAKLSSRGFYFENGYSVIPITLPSHASMFYSLYPHELKILNNGHKNNVKIPALPQIMKRGGYQTGAVISLGVLKSELGLNRGFDHFVEKFEPYKWIKVAENVNRDLYPVILKMKGNKSFFWVHYSDPHKPYYPPYFDGTFSFHLNGEEILSAKSIDSLLIRKTLSVNPGENYVDLKTMIPSQIQKDPDLDILYISYKGFFLSSPDKKDLEIIFPDSWRSKGRETKDYFTNQTSSRILIKNKKRSSVEVTLRFLYELQERNKSRKKLYRKSIQYMDEQIGNLISFLKKENIFKQSMFIIMGDHGEGLGEYLDHYGHIHYLNKLYSRVPFIVSGKGVKRKGQRDDLVSNLEIAPTILDYAGLKVPEFMTGESVFNKIKRKKLIIETFSPQSYFDAFSLIEFPYQIIFYPGRKENRIEYIDLINDPLGINTSFVIKDGKIRSGMLKSILQISRTITATKGKIGKKKRVNEEILKSLGYL
ncbi:MAG: sulfatase [Acidobacteriota bacterium]